jgi:regulator of cell morphogenesis and NO signaling
MPEFKEQTISDIVRDDYRTADVFKANGINFCCNGKITLEDACRERNLDLSRIEKALEEATRAVRLSPTLQFNEWKIDFLVDYIIHVHHGYLFRAIPELDALFISFMANHTRKFPELVPIYEVFKELSEMLINHNRNEEDVIFPYIKHIEMAYRKKETYGPLFVRTLRKPLSLVEKEHEAISALLVKLKDLTHDYTFPEGACTNHQVLYHKLKEFHYDMVQHKHLENNILFVKAIEIERQLLQI